MNRLFAARYDDAAYAGSIAPAENWEDIGDLGIRWALPGGIQRIELTVRARSSIGAYGRYKDHLGHRVAIYDNLLDRYIGGQIYEVIPDGRHVTYICAGPWKRAFDDRYRIGDMPLVSVPTGDTATFIADILTDSVSIEEATTANISNSLVSIGGWTPDPDIGTLAGDALTQLSLIGNSSNSAMDFYFVDQLFDGVYMQKPLPYFKARSTTASIDWQFDKADLVRGGLSLGRNIWELKTKVNIGYNRIQGADDGADNNKLVDSSATFVDDGVQPGDTVINITDDTIATVDSLTNTQITFTDAALGTWGNGDEYSIQTQRILWTGQSSNSTDYWDVIYNEVRPEMDNTQATAYRNQIANLYDDAQQQQSFVIGAPYIKDGNGAKYPLWRPLMGDSFYFRINDLFPEAALFSTSDDRRQAFLAVAMDYTYRDNRLRIVPSTGDSRLDALLNQARITNAWLIGTEARFRSRAEIVNEEPPEGWLPPGVSPPGDDRGGGGGGHWQVWGWGDPSTWEPWQHAVWQWFQATGGWRGREGAGWQSQITKLFG
jgi:hypothetical protein